MVARSEALLLTDIVDSTQIGARLGDDAMSRLWHAHDLLSRDLLRQWRGQEITRSDGFLLRFDRVDDAVRYAHDYHRALASLDVPLQARAGLHLGPLTSRENRPSDVAGGARATEIGGLSIAMVSRVMSIAHGGQTLLTAEARHALQADDHRVRSHGHWRLKGFEEPFELFEAGGADTAFSPPADGTKAYRVVGGDDGLWIPRRAVAHSLPAERNAFVGRVDALQQLAERMQHDARLVSVLGPGGTGKTRLVQHFGRKWLGDFEGGAWFCDLSQAATRDGLISAVAQGLDVPLGTTPPIEQLGAAIAGRGHCLVIFDNFEQIAHLAPETVGYWLDRAPDARFIVTTRTVLNIDGEAVLSLAQMAPAEGAALFVQRAKAARRDFTLTTADAPRLDALVALLDGLPLAIELAAARVRIMSIATLIDRMKERFRILAAQSGRVGRHATLRATLDWSWDLLTPVEREALARASVFEGGFGIAGFEAVLDLPAGSAHEPIDILQSLVDKSWIQQSRGARFGLLQTVQEYGGERLRTPGSFDGSGPECSLATLRLHWRFHAHRTQAEATADGSTDLDNFIHACRRATAAGDAEAAAATLENAWKVLNLCGPFQAISPLAAGVSSMPNLQPADLALTDFVSGSAHLIFGALADAEACFDKGLVHAREAGHARHEAVLLCQLGELYGATGRRTLALKAIADAVRLCDRLDDPTTLCAVLNASGNLHQRAGAFDEAHRQYTRALAVAGERRDLRWQGGLLGNLGAVTFLLGRLDEARRHYEGALALVQQTGERRWEGNTRCNLGLLLSDLGEPTEARAHLEAALTSARQLGQRKLECTVLLNLGILAEATDRVDAACALYDDALRIALAINDLRCQGQCYAHLGMVHGRLGSHRRSGDAVAQARQLLTTVGDRWSLALLLCNMGELAVAAGRLDDAEAARAEARDLIDDVKATADSELGVAYEKVDRLLRGRTIGTATLAV